MDQQQSPMTPPQPVAPAPVAPEPAPVGVPMARLEPIWRRAGEVGAIVAWHVADPVAFFKKPDEKNERYKNAITLVQWVTPSASLKIHSGRSGQDVHHMPE